MNSKKSINSFEMKKTFTNLLIIFRHCYHAKQMFLTSLIYVTFFIFLLYLVKSNFLLGMYVPYIFK